jgi:PREDICTED: similar to predicted protein
MNQRFMDLEALEIYAKNLITYSNYLNDSMNKIAAGFNNLSSEKIIQGRRSKVFEDVYAEMQESRENVVNKLYQLKEFVEVSKQLVEQIDTEEGKKFEPIVEELGIKRGNGSNGGSSGGSGSTQDGGQGSNSGGSQGSNSTEPSRTTTEADEAKVEENLSKTSTGKGEEQTQNETSNEGKMSSEDVDALVDQDTSNQNNTDQTKPSSGDNKMSSEDVDALVDQGTQGTGENNNSDSYVARKVENPYGMSTEEFNYFRNMDRNNEDYIAPENMDSAYEKYRETRYYGDKVMSEEEFYIKHSNLSPEEKNYRMQELIDKDLRIVTQNIQSSGNPLMGADTTEKYVNNLQSTKYYNSDKSLFYRGIGEDSPSVKDLYNETLGKRIIYDSNSDKNIGLRITEKVKIDGQEYTLTVDTDKVPTQKEWNQERINFLNKVSNPNSKIESSRTDYSFFNMDLDKAREAYEKTLL